LSGLQILPHLIQPTPEASCLTHFDGKMATDLGTLPDGLGSWLWSHFSPTGVIAQCC